MSKIITIKNDSLEVQISTLGAEIVSIKKDGEEKIWQGDPKVWEGHAPILFPVCGCIWNGYYTLDGKRYEIGAHGFARKKDFEVVAEEKTQATFLLECDAKTKSAYPFDFKFRVMFKLNGDTLGIYYIVENHGDSTMYYNVGCHEGFKTENAVDGYYIKFDKEYDELDNSLLSENFINLKTNKIKVGEKGVNLGEFFIPENDGESIIFENISSKRLSLFKEDKELLSVYYQDFDHLVLWTEGNADFIAIEPWNGLPDVYKCDNKLETKKAISKLDAKATKTFYHSITFFE